MPSRTSAGPSIAVVTGAGRGFGRAISDALVADGATVVGIARTATDLDEARAALGPRFVPVVGDATDESLAADVLATHRPGLLVLNAGAVPHIAPLPDQTWMTFSRNWDSDTRHAFTWIRAALRLPLEPGSTVVALSSGAAIVGSPLSGGYAAAKVGVRFLARYAAEEAQRAGLGIRFHALFPQLTPTTGLGMTGVRAYAERRGVDEDVVLRDMDPALSPQQVAAAVLGIAGDPGSPAEQLLGADGLRSVG